MITKIKKLKNNSNKEHSSEDLKGRILENQEENQCLNNRNQELENQIKKLEIEKKSQDEIIEKIHNHNNLLENQEAQIQENASKNQIEEVKTVLAAIQKKEKQTTHTPYRHPNYNHHFHQRQDQNKHSHKNYVNRRKDQYAKQQLK